MTNNFGEPLPDAPITARSLALLNLAECAAEVSDSARAFFPWPDSRYDGTLFGDALRFLRHAEELVAAAVVAERQHGATWEQLAEAAELTKSTVHKRWSPAETAWKERLEQSNDERLVAPLQPDAQLRPLLGSEPEAIAARLDKWVARHAQPGDLIRGDAAGTALLERMTPMEESLFLTGQSQRLLQKFMVPPPACRAPIAARQAVVDEALADAQTSPRLAAELRDGAAKHRAFAEDQFRSAAAGNTGTPWSAFTAGPPAGDADTDDPGEENV
ncbi:MAG: hypothetical protein QOF58_1949 [Pseudonocardiales bacterium]|jgi:hypothetical protein|nr:hypothetical protein [Pseudonocardiales bacterium]